jgi:hypothetical protein
MISSNLSQKPTFLTYFFNILEYPAFPQHYCCNARQTRKMKSKSKPFSIQARGRQGGSLQEIN